MASGVRDPGRVVGALVCNGLIDIDTSFGFGARIGFLLRPRSLRLQLGPNYRRLSSGVARLAESWALIHRLGQAIRVCLLSRAGLFFSHMIGAWRGSACTCRYHCT